MAEPRMQWNCCGGLHAWWNHFTLRLIQGGAVHSLSGAQTFRLRGRDDDTERITHRAEADSRWH